VNYAKNINDNIKALLEIRNISIRQLADQITIPASTLTDSLKSKKGLPVEVAIRVANALRFSVEELSKMSTVELLTSELSKGEAPPALSRNIGTPYHADRRIPILGRISAGQPLYADQYIEGYTYIDATDDAEYFALRVTGDSMSSARINDGDILVVRRQDDVDDGDIAVVLVNGMDATVKRVQHTNNSTILIPQSHNPAHLPQVYGPETDVKILGRVMENKIKY
jgi:repressor LexA